MASWRNPLAHDSLQTGGRSEPAPVSRLVIPLIEDPGETLMWVALQVSAMPGFCQMTDTLPPLLDSLVGGGTPGRSCFRPYGSNIAVPG
ncbi:hypothetical protein TNCV_3179881 [Trichonephila clavipes]|nr:hypothetical protein TNCV_3179881 [Trichonephila clavipes]